MFRACSIAILLAAAVPTAAWAGGNDGDRSSASLPADFRGKVDYFGNNTGKTAGPRASARRVIKGDCGRPDQQCMRLVGGSLEVTLYFVDDIVHGRYQGTGGVDGGRLIGRRTGNTCEMFDRRDGSRWVGTCTEQGFEGTIRSVPHAPELIEVSFSTLGTRATDYRAIWERRREAARRAERMKILMARLNGAAPIDYKLSAAVELDSFGWASDGYRQDSLRVSRRTKPKKGFYQIWADFQLQSGGSAWVRGEIVDDRISCLEFWDLPGVCRPILEPKLLAPTKDDEAIAKFEAELSEFTAGQPGPN